MYGKCHPADIRILQPQEKYTQNNRLKNVSNEKDLLKPLGLAGAITVLKTSNKNPQFSDLFHFDRSQNSQDI